MEVLQKHRFSQFDSPRQVVPDIPHWLDEVVRKCLEKKPEDRYPDAYVLMLRLEEIPRKIDFKAAAEEEADPDSETLAATVATPEKLRVGGTLVRDLFRAEAEAQARSDGWLRIFDNLWVLIGVLLLCLVGAWAAWRGTHLSPEARFERGVALMEQPEGAVWEEAQEKYFNPLLQLDAETWEPRVAPYLSRIQLYTLKRQLLGRSLARDPLPRSEPEAVFRQALELRRLGRLAEAEQKIAALNVLIADNPDLQQLQSPVARLHEELVKEQLARRFDYLRSALRRAEDFRQAGQVSQAQAIWRSVLELYDSDPDAIEWTTQARNSLQSAVPAAPSSSLPADESR
jgi:serine/threonine-protein kinase